MDIKELIILLASSLALAALAAFSLEFPDEELTATNVKEALGDLSKAALTAPKRPWLNLSSSLLILITAIGFPDRLASDLLS